MSTLRDRFQGCMLGLALGDAFNAPLEGGVIERLVWRMIGSTSQGERRYTDDTQMSLDLARSLIACGQLELDDVATRFAASYQWSRGYGPGAAKLLKRVRRGEAWSEVNTAIFPGGSWGNGGAMRAPVIGLRCVYTPDVMEDWARRSAQVTHAHELGMQGAAMMAAATAVAVRGEPAGAIVEAARQVATHESFSSRLTLVAQWLSEDEPRSPRDVRKQLGCGMAAAESCPAALYLACVYMKKDFEALIEHAGKCGGDTDTVGAMAGAIWGAARGVDALPQAWLVRLEDAAPIREVATALCEEV